jgi:FG-GAP repeat protein/Big-like domain-containing protein
MLHILRRVFVISGAIALWALPNLCSAIWIQTARLTDSGGGAGEFLGDPVAIDGNVAVVAAQEFVDLGTEHPAVVLVFVRSGGVWTQAANLVASDDVASNLFGAHVAIRGDTIAVGAPTDGNISRDGVVYVYVKPAGGWSGTLTESAQLAVPTTSGTTRLGNRVAFANDSIASIGGGPIGRHNNTFPNTVFVFNKPGSGWSGNLAPDATLTCSFSSPDLLFSLGASGNVILSGAPGETVGGNAVAGGAFIWVKPSGGWTGTITNSAELLPSDPGIGGFFGWGVAIDGNTAVVGTSPNNGNLPKCYVFERPSAGWNGNLTENAQLTPSDALIDSFAVAAISGTNVVVFSRNQDALGSLYTFERPSTGWSGVISESQELMDPQSPSSDFGTTPAISGTTILGGAPVDTVGGNVSQGAAYVFDLLHPFSTRTRFLVEGPIRVAPGVPVEFPVQVEAGRRAPSQPTGIILIRDGQGQECRAILDATGTGSCALTFSNAGLFRVRAHYLGNSEFDDSTSPTLTVHAGQAGAN